MRAEHVDGNTKSTEHQPLGQSELVRLIAWLLSPQQQHALRGVNAYTVRLCRRAPPFMSQKYR